MSESRLDSLVTSIQDTRRILGEHLHEGRTPSHDLYIALRGMTEIARVLEGALCEIHDLRGLVNAVNTDLADLENTSK